VRAVVISRHGRPEVLEVQERPDPPVGPGEVRIAVKAAGINFADTLARIGLYPDAPKPPCVLGYEVAGEIESVGEGVESHKVGDRVVAGTRFKGQAELVTVPEAQALPLPEKLSFEQGAAFPVNYGTAYAARVGRPNRPAVESPPVALTRMTTWRLACLLLRACATYPGLPPV